MNGMRSFDPREVGRCECGAWIAYYRRRWGPLLAYSVGMVRAGFRLPWPKTLRGAWFVLRANQVWAPAHGNDPRAARRYMRRFYELVNAAHGERFDAGEAARLEVEWWRVHRELPADAPELVEALTELYAHVYGADPDRVRPAAVERAEAMAISDRWVTDGCDPESPALADEQAALVRSYAALLAAVHYPAGSLSPRPGAPSRTT